MPHAAALPTIVAVSYSRFYPNATAVTSEGTAAFAHLSNLDILLTMIPRALPLLFLLALFSLMLAACGGDGGGGFKSELVTEADFPVTLAFAPDGRLFYTEKRGRIRVVSPEGELLPEPFAAIDNVAKGVEWGLIGLALDPDFDSNHHLYIYYTERQEPEAPKIAKPIVMRFTDLNSLGADPAIVLDDLPQTDSVRNVGAHVGGNLDFGPDGFLYISIGDMEIDRDAQDLRIARGTIIRVDKADGSAPPDNPFVDNAPADPRIWAYGFRNPFEFTFHPDTGRLYAADNGSFKCDKLVIVEKGNNYGWPNLDAFCSGEGVTSPLYLYALPGKTGLDVGSNVGATGLQFVSGVAAERYPALAGSLLACEFNTGFMRSLVLGGESQREVLSDDVVAEGCRIDIDISPDGIIYYSNQTEIRRLLPE